MTQGQISDAISELRHELHLLAEIHGCNLTHPDILRKSRQVDRLIVLWQRYHQPLRSDPGPASDRGLEAVAKVAGLSL